MGLTESTRHPSLARGKAVPQHGPEDPSDQLGAGLLGLHSIEVHGLCLIIQCSAEIDGFGNHRTDIGVTVGTPVTADALGGLPCSEHLDVVAGGHILDEGQAAAKEVDHVLRCPVGPLVRPCWIKREDAEKRSGDTCEEAGFDIVVPEIGNPLWRRRPRP